jgi:hypothetical protein
MAGRLMVLLFVAVVTAVAAGFGSMAIVRPQRQLHARRLVSPRSSAESSAPKISVKDLGLTMEDVMKSFPKEMLQELVTSGYESTSRVPGNTDQGAAWAESAETVEVTLTVPGLRGQPAASLSIEATDTTLTLTAWGRAIWSCVLRGAIDPKTASMSAEDGMAMLPVIKFSARKAGAGRWGGFIQAIGEDSLL